MKKGLLILLTLAGLYSCTQPQSTKVNDIQILSNKSFNQRVKTYDVYVHDSAHSYLLKPAFINNDTIYGVVARELAPFEREPIQKPTDSQFRYKHRNDINVYVNGPIKSASNGDISVPSSTITKIQEGHDTVQSKSSNTGVIVLIIVLVFIFALFALLLFTISAWL